MTDLIYPDPFLFLGSVKLYLANREMTAGDVQAWHICHDAQERVIVEDWAEQRRRVIVQEDWLEQRRPKPRKNWLSPRLRRFTQ